MRHHARNCVGALMIWCRGRRAVEAFDAAAYADAIRTAVGHPRTTNDLNAAKVLVLMCCRVFPAHPRVPRLSILLRQRRSSRDLIGQLRGAGLIASGPRRPYTCALYLRQRRRSFLLESGSTRCAICLDFEALEDAVCLFVKRTAGGEIPGGLARGRANDEEVPRTMFRKRAQRRTRPLF